MRNKIKELQKKLDIQELSLSEALRLIKVYRQFITYGFIGISAAITDITIFAILYNYNILPEITSNILSTTISIIQSFILNTFFNFKKKDNLLKRFILFFLVCAVGLGASTLMLFVFSTQIGIDANIVKIISLPVVLVIQYTLNKKITFK
jgi:putative flippase GtrA